jgi:N-6 DNA Methylase
MPRDPAILAHQEWLGYVQPTGLVVSIPSLINASAFLNRNYGPEHQRLLSALPQDSDGSPVAEISDFARFARDVFGWDSELILGSPGAGPVPPELEVNLENYNETLRPTYALRSLNGEVKWLLLVELLPTGTDLDQAFAPHDRGWQASPQARFERLLRQTGVHIGLLVNGRQMRLVYAPEKELSGHITFKLADMVQVAGRPIFAALQMLLSAERLYSVADKERLPAILANSRKYQNVVSTQLATQVLEALYELLRGFQAANDQSKGDLLRDVLARDPDHVYGGLLTTLLRLVFVLYAEDRGLLSTDPIYSNNYSITGLYERLRADASRYPDTMDQRYGAWAQLLALFRLIYSGGSHGAMKIPAREGYLFDPDRYLFLEGRQGRKDKPSIPRVPDGVAYRVLSKLLLLDGERLSYRTLAVEQIGSVYEAIMGFELQVAAGKSIAIKPTKKHGAPATVNLEGLLQTASDKRLKWFAETTDQKLTGQAAEGLKNSTTIEELLVALDRKIAKAVTPNVVPQGAMIFEPSNERRKSGSHYTPSSLTGPIVEAALAPVLKHLGDNPAPQQILNLKICDPAMGSGAFLVQACRQLGDELMKAWHAHDDLPVLPPDEEEALHAQRIVAQRCLYGVDKNPMAVDLAKLSLWLATLAKDHPFTFLDHSLRHGDSLVGLTRQQIAAFNWEDDKQQTFLEQTLRNRIERVSAYRQRILAARDDVPYAQLKQELDGAEESLRLARMVGDTVVAAFFYADKAKARDNARIVLRGEMETMLKDPADATSVEAVEGAVSRLREGRKGIAPFHWGLEFPEVFTIEDKGNNAGGFDVIVGNPPFAGKNTAAEAHAGHYLEWLQEIHEESHGNADLVTHFFRRAFSLLRQDACFGLIATNTIGQGDTRKSGLRWICTHGGTIYRARKRLRWPGQAAVVVSVLHVSKGHPPGPYLLDQRQVPFITAYLFHAGGHEDPLRLQANKGKSFIGCYVLGMGFTFDDTDSKGVASHLADMDDLISRCPRNKERIFPFISGEELNESPTQSHHRYVINFADWPLVRRDLGARWGDSENGQRAEWLRAGIVPADYPGPVAADFPDLLQILERKVKPEREKLGDKPDALRRKRLWWKWGRYTPGLFEAIAGLPRVLTNALYGTHLAFVFMDPNVIFANKVNVMPFTSFGEFGLLQSRVHELWARFFSATLKDDLAYAPSDCLETFPFPGGLGDASQLESIGQAYYEGRSQTMKRRSQGLTDTYNRFHDRNCDDGDIESLRGLHDAMDRSVLDSYGWGDIRAKCEFVLEFDDPDEGEDGDPSIRKKYRYRWPDEVRDEVLARLLDLNRGRAREEGQIIPGETVELSMTKRKKPIDRRPRTKTPRPGSTSGLFATEEDEV